MRRVVGEFDTDFFEVSQQQKKTIKQPVHFALAVLSHAKLEMLKFAMLLSDNLDTDRFRLMYTGCKQ